jgi:CHAT domain-containing protein/tetratricopeptide (TPR) repeat protein
MAKPCLFYALCIIAGPAFSVLAQQSYDESFKLTPRLIRADSLFQADNFTNALNEFNKAAAYYETSKNYPAYVYSLNQAGRCYYELRDISKLGDVSGKTLAIARQMLDADHPEISQTFVNLGYYYWLKPKRDQDSSFFYFENAVQLSERNTPLYHIYRCYSYQGIARNYYSTFNFQRAIKFYQDAIAILEHDSEKYKGDLSKAYHNLGISLRGMGEIQGARFNLEAAIRIYEALPKTTSRLSSLYRAMTSLANTYVDELDYYTSRKIYQEIINSIEDNNSTSLIRPLANIAVAFAEEGQFELALKHIKRAIQIEKSNPNNFNEERLAENYIQYSHIYRLMNQPDSMKYYAGASLKIYQKLYKEGNLATAACHQFIAIANKMESKYTEALTNIQQALIDSDKSFNSLNISANPTLNQATNLDKLYELLAIKANLFYLRYQESKNSSDLESAYQLYVTLDELTDEIRAGLYSRTTKLLINAALKREAENALKCIYFMFTTSNSKEYLGLAFKYLEKNRYAEMFENLSSVQAVSQTGLPDSLYRLELDLQFRLANQKQLLLSTNDPASIDSIKEMMFSINKENQELQDYLSQNYSSYYQSKYGELISLDSLQKILVDKTQLVEYFIGKSSLVIFSVTKESSAIILVPLSEEFTYNINSLLAQISAPINLMIPLDQLYQTYSNSAFSLYKILIEPVVETRTTKLIISPDGILSKLPFECLLSNDAKADFKSAPYIFKNMDIQYVYNLNLLYKFTKPKLQKTPSLLAFSYSDIDPSKVALRSGRSEIPASALELIAISRFFDGDNDNFLIGEEATETAFKNLSSRFEIIHLAVHGVGDTTKAINSRLEFKVGKDTLNDGKLFAHELYNLNLERLRLAILSACETGIGKELPGEGVFSIARGFAYAGCPAVVMSLWQVNDTYTAKLMEYFYANLTQGKEIDLAVRNAKLTFLENADSREAFPYYWSGFIAQGNVSPVTRHRFRYIYLLYFLLPLALAGGFIYVRRRRK